MGFAGEHAFESHNSVAFHPPTLKVGVWQRPRCAVLRAAKSSRFFALEQSQRGARRTLATYTTRLACGFSNRLQSPRSICLPAAPTVASKGTTASNSFCKLSAGTKRLVERATGEGGLVTSVRDYAKTRRGSLLSTPGPQRRKMVTPTLVRSQNHAWKTTHIK